MSRLRLLGIAERVVPSSLADGIRIPISIMNLRRAIISSIFPLNVSRQFLVFAFEEDGLTGSISIKVSCGSSRLEAIITLEGPNAPPPPSPIAIFSLPLTYENKGMIAWEPGAIQVETICGNSETQTAYIPLFYGPLPPMSDEIRRALLTKANTAKMVRIQIACDECHDEIVPIVALKREPKGYGHAVWYEDLPDLFVCRCQKLKVPLTYLRTGMPSLLTQTNNILPDGSIIELAMTREEAYRIVDKFRELISTDPLEEEIQQYIQTYLLMLAPFAASKLYFKPPMLTKKKADFGILTPRNELILIEIERANLQILKTKGGQAAPLTHAVDQTREWEEIITEHRAATLAMIDPEISPANIKYVVIAGRASEEHEESTNRLLRSSRHPEFMTYDHLIASVEAIIKATY